MENIQISSYVGIALDVIVEIVVFIIVWQGHSDNDDEDDGGMREVYRNKNRCGKLKFIFMKIILGFGLSFADTITGEKLLF